MTRRVILPSEPEVRTALEQLRKTDGSRLITVLDLARQHGLANSTFWRHFPGIAQEVADERRSTLRSATTFPADSPRTNNPDEALRKENVKLRDQLELAVAHIQRLTIDNQALRDQLEAQTNIVKLTRAGSQR